MASVAEGMNIIVHNIPTQEQALTYEQYAKAYVLMPLLNLLLIYSKTLKERALWK